MKSSKNNDQPSNDEHPWCPGYMVFKYHFPLKEAWAPGENTCYQNWGRKCTREAQNILLYEESRKLSLTILGFLKGHKSHLRRDNVTINKTCNCNSSKHLYVFNPRADSG